MKKTHFLRDELRVKNYALKALLGDLKLYSSALGGF